MYDDMTAVTYNLTKLFQMKLKTIKCHSSHLMGKKQGKLLAHPIIPSPKKVKNEFNLKNFN